MSEVCFKDSGIEWIGEIPEHWGIKKLKFLGKFFGGLTGKVAEDFSKEEQKGYSPFIPFVNICNNIVVDNNKMEYVKTDDNDQQNLVLNQDILFMMTSENREDLGKSAIYLGEQTPFLNSFCKGFRATDLEIKPKFLVWLLQGNRYREYFGLMGNGFTRINLRLYPLQNLNIALPPLQEQEAIARYLDEKTQAIDELITTHQKSIEKLESYRISLISEVVTQGLDKNAKLKDSGIEWMGKIPKHWKMMKIRFLFSIHSGLNITKEDLKDEGIPCISYGEIHSKFPCRVNPQIHSLPFVDEEFINTRPKSLLNNGDFVFADTSEDIEGSGNFSSIQTNSTAFAGYHTIVLKPINKDIYSPYFSFLFDSLQLRTQIRSRVCGVKVYSITKSLLRDVFCIIPPLQEQEAIAHYLDEKTQAIDELIATHQKSIEKLKNYRTSLISEAVIGKKNLQGINNGN